MRAGHLSRFYSPAFPFCVRGFFRCNLRHDAPGQIDEQCPRLLDAQATAPAFVVGCKGPLNQVAFAGRSARQGIGGLLIPGEQRQRGLSERCESIDRALWWRLLLGRWFGHFPRLGGAESHDVLLCGTMMRCAELRMLLRKRLRRHKPLCGTMMRCAELRMRI